MTPLLLSLILLLLGFVSAFPPQLNAANAQVALGGGALSAIFAYHFIARPLAKTRDQEVLVGIHASGEASQTSLTATPTTTPTAPVELTTSVISTVEADVYELSPPANPATTYVTLVYDDNTRVSIEKFVCIPRERAHHIPISPGFSEDIQSTATPNDIFNTASQKPNGFSVTLGMNISPPPREPAREMSWIEEHLFTKIRDAWTDPRLRAFAYFIWKKLNLKGLGIAFRDCFSDNNLKSFSEFGRKYFTIQKILGRIISGIGWLVWQHPLIWVGIPLLARFAYWCGKAIYRRGSPVVVVSLLGIWESIPTWTEEQREILDAWIEGRPVRTAAGTQTGTSIPAPPTTIVGPQAGTPAPAPPTTTVGPQTGTDPASTTIITGTPILPAPTASMLGTQAGVAPVPMTSILDVQPETLPAPTSVTGIPLPKEILSCIQALNKELNEQPDNNLPLDGALGGALGEEVDRERELIEENCRAQESNSHLGRTITEVNGELHKLQRSQAPDSSHTNCPDGDDHPTPKAVRKASRRTPTTPAPARRIRLQRRPLNSRTRVTLSQDRAIDAAAPARAVEEDVHPARKVELDAPAQQGVEASVPVSTAGDTSSYDGGSIYGALVEQDPTGYAPSTAWTTAAAVEEVTTPAAETTNAPTAETPPQATVEIASPAPDAEEDEREPHFPGAWVEDLSEEPSVESPSHNAAVEAKIPPSPTPTTEAVEEEVGVPDSPDRTAHRRPTAGQWNPPAFQTPTDGGNTSAVTFAETEAAPPPTIPHDDFQDPFSWFTRRNYVRPRGLLDLRIDATPFFSISPPPATAVDETEVNSRAPTVENDTESDPSPVAKASFPAPAVDFGEAHSVVATPAPASTVEAVAEPPAIATPTSTPTPTVEPVPARHVDASPPRVPSTEVETEPLTAVPPVTTLTSAYTFSSAPTIRDVLTAPAGSNVRSGPNGRAIRIPVSARRSTSAQRHHPASGPFRSLLSRPTPARVPSTRLSKHGRDDDLSSEEASVDAARVKRARAAGQQIEALAPESVVQTLATPTGSKHAALIDPSTGNDDTSSAEPKAPSPFKKDDDSKSKQDSQPPTGIADADDDDDDNDDSNDPKPKGGGGAILQAVGVERQADVFPPLPVTQTPAPRAAPSSILRNSRDRAQRAAESHRSEGHSSVRFPTAADESIITGTRHFHIDSRPASIQDSMEVDAQGQQATGTPMAMQQPSAPVVALILQPLEFREPAQIIDDDDEPVLIPGPAREMEIDSPFPVPDPEEPTKVTQEDAENLDFLAHGIRHMHVLPGADELTDRMASVSLQPRTQEGLNPDEAIDDALLWPVAPEQQQIIPPGYAEAEPVGLPRIDDPSAVEDRDASTRNNTASSSPEATLISREHLAALLQATYGPGASEPSQSPLDTNGVSAVEMALQPPAVQQVAAVASETPIQQADLQQETPQTQTPETNVPPVRHVAQQPTVQTEAPVVNLPPMSSVPQVVTSEPEVPRANILILDPQLPNNPIFPRTEAARSDAWINSPTTEIYGANSSSLGTREPKISGLTLVTEEDEEAARRELAERRDHPNPTRNPLRPLGKRWQRRLAQRAEAQQPSAPGRILAVPGSAPPNPNRGDESCRDHVAQTSHEGQENERDSPVSPVSNHTNDESDGERGSGKRRKQDPVQEDMQESSPRDFPLPPIFKIPRLSDLRPGQWIDRDGVINEGTSWRNHIDDDVLNGLRRPESGSAEDRTAVRDHEYDADSASDSVFSDWAMDLNMGNILYGENKHQISCSDEEDEEDAEDNEEKEEGEGEEDDVGTSGDENDGNNGGLGTGTSESSRGAWGKSNREGDAAYSGSSRGAHTSNNSGRSGGDDQGAGDPIDFDADLEDTSNEFGEDEVPQATHPDAPPPTWLQIRQAVRSIRMAREGLQEDFEMPMTPVYSITNGQIVIDEEWAATEGAAWTSLYQMGRDWLRWWADRDDFRRLRGWEFLRSIRHLIEEIEDLKRAEQMGYSGDSDLDESDVD